MLADYHMHSNYSNDSTYELEDLVIEAIRQGLDEICITEHSDYGSMGNYVVNYDSYYDG
ncbi:MAG: PHP domain-containing protein, partial [Coprobacillus sp.]